MSGMCFTLGFIAGEGSFQLTARKNSRNENYTSVRPKFSIVLSDVDEEPLHTIQSDLGGVGSIGNTGDGHVQLQVTSKEELLQVVKRIEDGETDRWVNTDKYLNFKLWSKIVRQYAEGRTTPEQKLGMLQTATRMKMGGRNRDTSLENHIQRVKNRIEQ